MDPSSTHTNSASVKDVVARRSTFGSLKTIVGGVSDRARDEGIPTCNVPTGVLKLPSTFISIGDAIVWPKFSGYDAAYLELAMREGLSLATTDRKLRTAIKSAGVQLFAPS